MKKFLLSIFAVMLAVFSVQAQEMETVYTLEPAKGSNSDYTKSCDITINGITWNLSGNSQMLPWRIGGKNLNAVDRALYSKTAMPTAVDKVVLNLETVSVTVNSAKLMVADNANFANATTVSFDVKANSNIEIAVSATAGSYYKFVFNVTNSTTSNKFVAVKGVTFYKAKGSDEGGSTEPETPEEEPETPVTPEEPEFPEPGTYKDVLSIESIGVESYPSYQNWSGVKLNSAAVYAGNSHKNNDAIQLRSSNSNSGIVTTESGGKAKKVSLEWSGTSTRTLNIYGKDTPYESPTDLYDVNKQGELLGTIVGGRSTEFTITKDYKYIGLRSNSGAMYLSWIEITWEVEPASYTLAVGETRYSTLSLGYDATIPQGAKAYVVSEVNGGYVTLEEVTGVIPAKEAVIIEATPGDYNFVQTTEGAAVVETNLLEGTRVDTYITEEAYVLWNVDGEACFCKADMTNGSFLNKANKAYLPASVASGAASYSFRFGEGTTGIDEMTEQRAESKEIYDLTGRKVEAIIAPGIYVVNGKKVLVK